MTVTQTLFKRKLVGFSVLLVFFMFSIFCLSIYKAVAQTQEHSTTDQSIGSVEGESQAKETDPGVVKFAFLAAAIAVSVGSVGAGAAVGYVGAAAMGAIGEKPELAGRALIFVGLAEGIAIYGLIIAIMILGKV